MSRAPRHFLRTAHLSPEHQQQLRRLGRTRGWNAVGKLLRAPRYIVEDMAFDGAVTAYMRDRIAAELDAMDKAVAS